MWIKNRLFGRARSSGHHERAKLASCKAPKRESVISRASRHSLAMVARRRETDAPGPPGPDGAPRTPDSSALRRGSRVVAPPRVSARDLAFDGLSAKPVLEGFHAVR